jgi:hypothetical protein
MLAAIASGLAITYGGTPRWHRNYRRTGDTYEIHEFDEGLNQT